MQNFLVGFMNGEFVKQMILTVILSLSTNAFASETMPVLTLTKVHTAPVIETTGIRTVLGANLNSYLAVDGILRFSVSYNRWGSTFLPLDAFGKWIKTLSCSKGIDGKLLLVVNYQWKMSKVNPNYQYFSQKEKNFELDVIEACEGQIPEVVNLYGDIYSVTQNH